MTIICSSTSALVTFWKLHVANYVAPLCSRLCLSHRKLAARIVSRASSSKQICSPKFDESEPYPSSNSLIYKELDELPLQQAGSSNGSPRPEAEKDKIENSWRWNSRSTKTSPVCFMGGVCLDNDRYDPLYLSYFDGLLWSFHLSICKDKVIFPLIPSFLWGDWDCCQVRGRGVQIILRTTP